MNENLNLVEILKDCPRGTKLYSSVLGEVELDHIDIRANYPIIIRLKDLNVRECLTTEGTLFTEYDGECILFPSREERDWSKFTAPWYDTIDWLEKQGEQKKQVHFPKFTFDDVLALQCCMETVKKVQEDKELYEQLNLIHNKIYDAYCLGKQGETSPILSNSSNTGKNKPKFDPKTLVAFDKVLVRLTKDCIWNATFFSHYDKEVNWGCYPCVTTSCKSYDKCIPYNDETKHLLGTSDEAPEYYRYWED